MTAKEARQPTYFVPETEDFNDEVHDVDEHRSHRPHDCKLLAESIGAPCKDSRS